VALLFAAIAREVLIIAGTRPRRFVEGGEPYGTRKFTLLVSVPHGVVTLAGPVVAPVGTEAVISVFETTLR
jgi:hypothetical protein